MARYCHGRRGYLERSRLASVVERGSASPRLSCSHVRSVLQQKLDDSRMSVPETTENHPVLENPPRKRRQYDGDGAVIFAATQQNLFKDSRTVLLGSFVLPCLPNSKSNVSETFQVYAVVEVLTSNAVVGVLPRRLVQRGFPSNSSLVGIKPISQENLHGRPTSCSCGRLP